MNYLPQEIEAWYLIPAIRRDISKCLVRDFKIPYEKIGNILGVSKAAVSQYLKGKRAGKITIPKKLDEAIMASCKLLADGKSSAVVEIEKALALVRKNGLSCSVCGEINDGVLGKCKEIKFENGNYKAIRKV